MNIIIKIFSCVCIILSVTSCNGQSNTGNADLNNKVNYKINYNIVNKDEKDIKEVLSFWNTFLNNDNLCYNTDLDWDIPIYVEHQSFIFGFLANLKDSKLQVTVLAINKVDSSLYKLKTIVTYRKDSTNITMIDYIFDTYIRRTTNGLKVKSALEYNLNSFDKKQVQNIKYFYQPNNHIFNEKEALKLVAFNKEISQKFNLPLLPFSYVVTPNTIEAYKALGFDFIGEQYVPNQSYSGFAEPVGKIIVAGNNSEYYSHEVVHLYIQSYVEKEGISARYVWFDEGIATLFGGSKGLPLTWHLKELDTYLSQNPTTDINDISKLMSVPNGKYMTEYNYAIGGLICKLIYEKKGINGLFELLKSGSTDADFYKIIENNFNVKKQDFGAFIRAELKKI